MISHGPTLIYDKSVIEGISKEASHWLHHHFHVVLAPPLLIEVIADLKKGRAGRTGEERVSFIASHIPSHAFTPTIDYRELFLSELAGYEVEMSRRPFLGGGRRIRDAGGETGVFFPEAPEAEAMRRWISGDFNSLERIMAAQWTDSLHALDLSTMKQQLKGLRAVMGKSPNHEKILAYADNIIEAGERFRTLSLCLALLNVPDNLASKAVKRWKNSGRLPIKTFAPYFCHLVRIELFFALALVTDIISDARPSHRADFFYLYYLPFTSIFTSNDKLHIKFAPLFMDEDQTFVHGEQLRQDMNELIKHYASLPQDVRATGTATYAAYPPTEGHFLTSQIYDRLQPDWRRQANVPKKRITPEESAKIMARLKPMMDAIEAANRES